MIYSVSELNALAARVFLQNPLFHDIQVNGEISGGKAYPSGHYYFTLKDKNASLNCVMFQQAMRRMRFQPKDGDAVILKGSIGIYEKTGKYQFIARSMEMQGIGNLYLRFEALKKELANKGYFSAANKKNIPELPRIIGLATSESGSVLHDILHVLRRRFAGFTIHFISVSVQGENAAGQIVQAIQTFNKMKQADVIILARGGGSLEDLWAFNEKMVAEAIFASKIPVISAIGHETDYTISDFVADLRAPTPSAAAELVLPEKQMLFQELQTWQKKLSRTLTDKLQQARKNWNYYSQRPVLRQPEYLFSKSYQWLDNQFNRMLRALQYQLRYQVDKTENQNLKLKALMQNIFQIRRQALKNQEGQLNMLDPLAVLNRGYTYIGNVSGKIVSSVSQLNIDDEIFIHWYDGKAKANITMIESEKFEEKHYEQIGIREKSERKSERN